MCLSCARTLKDTRGYLIDIRKHRGQPISSRFSSQPTAIYPIPSTRPGPSPQGSLQRIYWEYTLSPISDLLHDSVDSAARTLSISVFLCVGVCWAGLSGCRNADPRTPIIRADDPRENRTHAATQPCVCNVFGQKNPPRFLCVVCVHPKTQIAVIISRCGTNRI